MLKSIDANEVNLNRIVSNLFFGFQTVTGGFRIRLLGLGFSSAQRLISLKATGFWKTSGL